MDIVYRVGGDGYDFALFAERSDAERVARILTALRESRCGMCLHPRGGPVTTPE